MGNGTPVFKGKAYATPIMHGGQGDPARVSAPGGQKDARRCAPAGAFGIFALDIRSHGLFILTAGRGRHLDFAS